MTNTSNTIYQTNGSTSQQHGGGWTWGHWALSLAFIAVLGISLFLYNQLRAEMNALDPSARAFDYLQQIASDEVIEVAELEQIQQRVEAAGEAALNYFSLFEGLAFFITVVGGLITLVGVFAGFTFARRFNEVRDLEKEYTDKIQELEEKSRDNFQQLEKSWRTTARDVQLEYSERVQQLEKNWQDSLTKNEQLRSDFQQETTRLRKRFREVASRASLSLSLTPLARQQYSSGDLKGALETYQRAAALEESDLNEGAETRINPVLYYHIGYILTHLNRLHEAEEHLLAALDVEPGLQHARAALGYVYRRMGDIYHADLSDESLTADERQTARKERDAHYEQAEKQLLLALTNAPQLIDDDNESWYGALAGLYKRLKRFDEAKIYYARAAAVTPQSSYPVVNQALIRLIEDRNIDAARPLFNDVKRLAEYERQAELDNFWAYGDLLTAQLVLDDDRVAILATLHELAKILPDDNLEETVPLMQSTIRDIMQVYHEKGHDTKLMQTVLQEMDALYLPDDDPPVSSATD